MKAIVNGKLVFPDRICDGVILIEDGKIIASGENVTAPSSAEIIDAKGLYVGPGLFDRLGSIDAGKDANIIFVDEDFTVHEVYFNGERSVRLAFFNFCREA